MLRDSDLPCALQQLQLQMSDLHMGSLQEAAKAEAQALADAAAVGGEASEREAKDLAAATERQEAVCRSLLHELRFKKHAALEAGALPPCANTRTLTCCGTDRPSVSCLPLPEAAA